ncbi:MAG: ATP-binding cassette domain-containing protein [Calditrichaceae bacterium]
MQETIITIENLTSGYGEKHILNDISLEIYRGEIIAVIGTSGCGKTTLLKHLIGLLQPMEGDIQVLGKKLNNLDEDEFIELRKKLGVLFQNGALLNSIPIAENIAIPIEQHTDLSRDLINYIVKLKLQLVGLDDVMDSAPSELSGGMRKRAALARAIALDPEILFADEPGAGLDPVTLASLDNLLKSLKDKLGMTMVVVTHEVNSIKRIADRIIYLSGGSVLFTGTLQEAVNSGLSELDEFFNTPDSYS